MNYVEKSLSRLSETLKISDYSDTIKFDILPSDSCDRLHVYLELLEKWNKSHDLVSQKKYSDICDHHIIESVFAYFVYMQICASPIDIYIDIGTGAGLPGIVWTLCFSAPTPTLLFEPRAKRVHFLKEVKRVLKLEHLEVRESRFSLSGLSLGNALCTLRALKPSKEMIVSLQEATKNFQLVSLTTEKAEFGSVEDMQALHLKKICYHYMLQEPIKRQLRISTTVENNGS